MLKSSVASSGKAGLQTKHPVLFKNGAGECILVEHVEPGSIIAWGVDADMTSLVLGNFLTDVYVGDGKGGTKTERRRTLLLYGCFCEADVDLLGRPTNKRPYEEGRLMTQTFNDRESVAVLLEPGMF